MVEEDIQITLNNYDYPLSAAFIAKKSNNSKSDVNKILYLMERNGRVEKLDMQPPLWWLKIVEGDAEVEAAVDAENT